MAVATMKVDTAQPVLQSIALVRIRPDGWAPTLVETQGRKLLGGWLLQRPSNNKPDMVEDCYGFGWKLYGAKDVDKAKLEPLPAEAEATFDAIGVRRVNTTRWLVYGLEFRNGEVASQRLIGQAQSRGDALDEHYRAVCRRWLLGDVDMASFKTVEQLA